MSYKSVLNSSRVFLDPGNTTVTTDLTSPYISGVSVTIDVTSTIDFKQSGYLTILTETFYYTSKDATTFYGVTKITSGDPDFNIGDTVTQVYSAPNKVITTDSNLAGWYIDGTGNQASLRVADTPVIQPGVIRYTEENGFQGCVATTPTVSWVSFNAEQGIPGADGIINTMLEFENMVPTGYITSNIGQIVSNDSLAVDISESIAPPIYIKRIVADSTIINGVNIDTIKITDNSNTIALKPTPQPYTWDMSPQIFNLRPNPVPGETLNCFGETHRFIVRTGVSISTGQAVRTVVLSGALVVEPFTYMAPVDLNQYGAGSVSLSFVGIACENVVGDGNLTALICTSGIVPVRITNTSIPIDYGLKDTSITKPGTICVLNTDGFSANATSLDINGSSRWFEVGYFLENGAIAGSDELVLVKINPKFVTGLTAP